ncbi:hypothetical protein GC163_14360 [bacterium]|nr:hypothetical protein [bacterium]
MQRLCPLFIAWGFVVAASSLCPAAEGVIVPQPVIEPEWQEPLVEFASFLADLSANHMDEAWKKFQKMVPNPPAGPATPFEPDPLQAFKKSLGRFPPDIENLNVIAEQRWTPNSRKFYLTCDSQAGPVFVDVTVYRSKGRWFFGTLNYHVIMAANKEVLKRAEEIVPPTTLPQPHPVPLTTHPERLEMTQR